MSSIETKEKMTSFVEYFDRIAANNEYYLKTHKDQTSVVALLHKALKDNKESITSLTAALNDLQTSTNKILNDSIQLVADSVRAQERAEAAEQRAATFERDAAEAVVLKKLVKSVKDKFSDVVAFDYATCPVLLTNGKVIGFENVIDYWLRSDFFDSKISSMFMCPLSRQLIRVADMSSVSMVAGVAESLGLNMTMPFSFEYDRKHAPENFDIVPGGRPFVSRWMQYDIESQLSLFAVLVGLYRDRQYGCSCKIVQVNETHTVTMKMGAGVWEGSNHTYKIEFGLTVVENMIPFVHRIRYVSSRVESKLSDFSF
jgi:hypothetical protein